MLNITSHYKRAERIALKLHAIRKCCDDLHEIYFLKLLGSDINIERQVDYILKNIVEIWKHLCVEYNRASSITKIYVDKALEKLKLGGID